MPIEMRMIIASLILLVLSCSTPHPDEARSKQLFSEINEIAQKPISHSADIMQAMIGLNEGKKNFPADRDKMMADAQLGKEYFASGIDGHEKIISKYEELLTLPFTMPNADCLKSSIKVQRAMIESMEMTITELDLILDESITDKETFDSRSFQMKEDAKLLKEKVDEFEAEHRDLCSKSKLGLN